MNFVTLHLLNKYNGLDNTHKIKTVTLCRESWSGPSRCSRASRNANNQTADNQNSSVIVLFHLVVL